MNFNAYCFHDATLHQVVEDARQHTLTLNVSMGKDEWSDEYAPRAVIFHRVLNYHVHEGDCAGDITILDISDTGMVHDRHHIRLETTSGYRTWDAAAFEVRDDPA
jgi:hypothetical protein